MSDFLKHEQAFCGDELDKRKGLKVLVLGAGSLGSWVVDILSRQGYEKISVIDFDKVEPANLGNQNYDSSDISKKKVTQLATKVFKRLGIKISPIDQKLTKDNASKLIKGHDLVIDTFDNAESRNAANVECCKLGIDILHAGVGSMGFFDIAWGNSEYCAHEAKGRDICDYPMAVNLIFLCSSYTCEIVNKYCASNEKVGAEFWIKSLSFARK